MPHHDPLCPQKHSGWHIVLDGGCGYCEVIKKARLDEQARITRDIEEMRRDLRDHGRQFPSNFYGGIISGVEMALKKVSPGA